MTINSTERHRVPHFNDAGFCICACENCGAMECICPHCPCDGNAPPDAHRYWGPRSAQKPAQQSTLDVFTAEDAARYLGVKLTTFRSGIWMGRYPRPDMYVTKGRTRSPRWTRTYLDQWIKEHRWEQRRERRTTHQPRRDATPEAD